jgi:hypothetical protein
MPGGLVGYLSNFTVGGVAYGFDVRTSGYGESTDANLTIEPIPWAQTYTVVVQGAAAPGGTTGSMPVMRQYRAIVYTEVDYLLLRGQRGQQGILLTPREGGVGSSGAARPAVLTKCDRADFQDPNTPIGSVTIMVVFVMLT